MAKGSRQTAKAGTAWKARRGCILLPNNLGYFAPFLFGSRMQPLLARSKIATAVSPPFPGAVQKANF